MPTHTLIELVDGAERHAPAPEVAAPSGTSPVGAGALLRRELALLVLACVGLAWEVARDAGRAIAQVTARSMPRTTTRSTATVASAAAPDGRPMLRWGQALGVGLIAFGMWLLFDAPTLMHSADASPIGARRTAAMVVLRPLAGLSRDLGLSHVVSAADRLMGRTGGGVVQVVGPPVHHSRQHRPPLTAEQRGGALRPTPAAAPVAASATDALPPLSSPTAASPLRVLSVGDSLGVDFGGPFVNDLAANGVVNAVLDAHVDTGLSRPDYFDWPAELGADLARYQPQAVVVFLGANDPQNLVDGGTALGYGTPAWSSAYARRVGALMQQATSSGARVLWVGMPPMADPGLSAEMQSVDAIYQNVAAAHPGVTYLSSWPVLSDPQGGFTEYLPDSSGSEVAVREPDGTHVSPGSAERLAEVAIATMDHAWGLTLQP